MTTRDRARLESCLGRAHRALWEACELAREDRTDDLLDDLTLHLREVERAQEAVSRRR